MGLDSQILSLLLTSGKVSKVYSSKTPCDAITNKDSVILALFFLKKYFMIIKNQKVPAAQVHSRFGSTRDPRGHGVTSKVIFSPLRHMEQLLLVTSCDSPAGIGVSLRTHYGRTDGYTDVMLQIVFQMWFQIFYVSESFLLNFEN